MSVDAPTSHTSAAESPVSDPPRGTPVPIRIVVDGSSPAPSPAPVGGTPRHRRGAAWLVFLGPIIGFFALLGISFILSERLFNAVATIFAMTFGLMVLVLALWVAYEYDLEVQGEKKIGRLLPFVLIFMFVGGAAFGSSPFTYEYVAAAWKYFNLNAAEINPIAAPKRGTDFTFANRTITFVNTPTDTLWAVKIGTEKPELVSVDVTTYTIPDRVNGKSLDPKNVVVFWQHRLDGRTSSPVEISND